MNSQLNAKIDRGGLEYGEISTFKRYDVVKFSTELLEQWKGEIDGD